MSGRQRERVRVKRIVSEIERVRELKKESQRVSERVRDALFGQTGPKVSRPGLWRAGLSMSLHVLVYLVIYDSGKVSLEHLLLSRHPLPGNPESITTVLRIRHI